MATHRQFVCSRCSHSHPAPSMLAALEAVARRRTPKCENCGRETKLHLVLNFALDVGGRKQVVEAAYLPRKLERWRNKKGHAVTFYPFLVITRCNKRDRCAWLPYWHRIDEGRRTVAKYGQWAPFMARRHFDSLLSQAIAEGALPKLSVVG